MMASHSVGHARLSMFDSLDRGIMLHRFENLFGISLAALGWIASYRHDRYQVVVIDGEHSDPVLLEHGVPKGSVLGPKKYTMYSKPLGAIICRYGLWTAPDID